MSSEDSRLKMLNQLRKNTEAAIKEKQDFFDIVAKSVDKIYSFGFSFSKIDEVYIMEICSKLPTANVTWYLNDYDDIAQRNEYTKVIKSCGFEGKFDTYHIS
jgi:isocitrate lyase